MDRLLRFAFVLILLLSAVTPFLAKADDTKELRILRITPTGNDVTTTRQIVLEFNRPVVPVGRMERSDDEVGITITPPVKCQWRWLNTTSLSCNLSDKDSLQKATTYQMSITPVIKAEDGAMIQNPQDHSFTTERPAAYGSNLLTWEAPTTPLIQINFNHPVTKSSVESHIYFENTDTKERIGADVHADKDDTRDIVKKNNQETRDLWVIKPKLPLPANTKFSISQEPGLVSLYGDETGIETKSVRDIFTFSDFSFLGVRCWTTSGGELFLKFPSVGAQDLCDPMRPINMMFSSPVLRSMVADKLTITPSLGDGNAESKPWGTENRDWSRLSDQRYDQNSEYGINLPWGMKAATQFTLSLPAQKYTLWQKIVAFFKRETLKPQSILTDEFGRTLAPFTFTFSTNHRKPNYELVYRDAVLEKGIDSDVPIYVNNLNDFSFSYDALTSSGARQGSTDIITLPDVQNIQYAVPAGIRSILNNQTGAVYANLKTSPSVDKWDGAGRLFAQITPFQIYAKLGHFSSSIWVSDLTTGAPVKDAKVTIYKGELTNLRSPQNPIETVLTDDNGIATISGLENIDPSLGMMRAWKDTDTRLFVRVDKDTDMGLLPISNDYEVQLWNINSDVYNYSAEKYGHMKSWGMTAQGIYRAGDTMQYKIYVRNQDNNKFVPPPSGKYSIEITDPTGKSVEKKDVTVGSFGAFDGEFKIPVTGSVGWYSFKLSADLPLNGKIVTKDFYPLSVLVSDFTPSPFRVTTELNGDHFKSGDTLDITANALLHSGGAYGDAAIRNTVSLQSKYFSSPSPAAKNFQFDSYTGDGEGTKTLVQTDEKINSKGEWKKSFALPEQPIIYGQIVVESAVKDDRGKSIASVARADYAGVDRLVGLKPTQWVFESRKPAIVQAIVVDDKGIPTPNTPVELMIEKETVVTSKVKGAGNAYLNDNTVEWTKTSTCSIISAVDAVDCAFTPEAAGSYRVTATIKDTKGRDHQTQQYLWVTGDDYVQWNEGREYALTILPEQNEYKVGDIARYLVKNPYPDAHALITVERFGVIDSFSQKLVGSAPVIEIPVKENYVPGFYVSIVAVSPRVDAPPPEMGQVDMGKPAFRVGYVKTSVPDPYKQIIVTAAVEKDVYQPNDTVRVALDAKPANLSVDQEPVELAVAVLDESVFDLIQNGKKSFDVYDGFYNLDSLDVANYSLLTRLMGRQKFEKKGANAGGDGGVDAGMRNNFKFVSYWNPSVPVDENGKANIEFIAPDNLTGWRVLAIATTPSDRMGLGDANFKVNRPTEVRPVMPNNVREGDKFSAGFSVMNRTEKTRTIKVSISATGDIVSDDEKLKEKSITLEPYKRDTVLIEYNAKTIPLTRDKPEGKISFSVTAGDEMDSDGLQHSIPVLKSRTIVTAATYGTTSENTASENIAIPKDIYTDGSDVGVTLSPSVIANLDGAFTYMKEYPYICWEQRLTKAVMAAQYMDIKPYLDDKTVWSDATTIPSQVLESASSYQAPNGGMAYFSAKDDYVDPYLSAYTALAFDWLKKSGHKIPDNVSSNLEKYLMGFLRNNSAPDYYSKEMISSVRAVILSAYKDTGKITPDDIIRLRGDSKTMSLFGKSHYIIAANNIPQTAHIARETLDMILSSGIESGGKLSFNQTSGTGFDRILTTPARDNCSALSALMNYNDQSIVGDKAFKMVRSITQSRGNRDHFENTQENMFCLNALIDYAKKYESETPDISVTALYGDTAFGTTTFKDVKDKAVTLTKPLAESDVGKTTAITLKKDGTGRFYYATRLRYADKSPQSKANAGIDIRREYSLKKDGKWDVVQTPVTIKRGDLVKVDLYMSVPTARNFVVVNDPLPGGLETVNMDLATSSAQDADTSDGGQDWVDFGTSRWGFYHKELRHDSVRFYSDWLDVGNYKLSYTTQAIASGTFDAPPTRAEEMYDPDIFGLGEKGQFIVQENH